MAKQVPTEHGSEAHSGTMGSHSQLSGVGTSDHHIKTGDNEVKGLILSGLDANKGAAGTDGKMYYATDTFKFYRDNGVSWVLIAVINLADLTEKAHSNLTGVGENDHHNKFENLVEDTTPQLGGNLDAQDKIIQKTDYVEVKERAAPATPASGYGRLYEKSDGKIYFKDDAGNEHDLTAGGGGGATSGTVILLNANETQANGTIGVASNDVAMKTYALGINTYSRIIVEFDGYIVFGANSQIQLGIRGEIGGNNGPYQKNSQDATGSGDYFWIPFSVKYSIQQQAAATITARIHHYAGADSTYYINNLRVYGVVT